MHVCLKINDLKNDEYSYTYIGKPTLTDMCCFWTATNILSPRNCLLQVKFDDGTGKLPYTETCFYSLTLPTMHKTYEMFKKYMDIALLHGSLGMDNS